MNDSSILDVRARIFDTESYTTSFPFITNSSTRHFRQECEWNKLNTALTFLLFLTFVLNILSSVVLFRVPLVTVRGRSNPVYLCIRFLNICDVLQAFFLIVMPIFATPNCGWLGGQISCGIMGFIVLFFLLVSPLITILMAFDRVIALYKPFKYRSHLGLKMLKILLPSACALVFLTTILPIFGIGQYHVVKGRRFCLLDTITENSVDRSYVIGVHTVFLLALLFMLSCTITFQVKLLRMSFHKKHQDSISRKKASSRRTRNATMTTMAVCCIFIVCYLPYVLRVLVEATTLEKSPNWITWITFGLAFLQPLLNPVVYVGTNVRYRQELQSMLKNISATELDTSSESNATHIVSRGAFSGFRRRLSSGGSKRGSHKRKNFGSRTSVNGVISPRIYDAKNSCSISQITRSNDKRKLMPPLKKFTKNGNKKGASLPLNSESHEEKDPNIMGEASSSSGVKSFDSTEKLLFAPPYISPTSLTYGDDSTAKLFCNDLEKYGRGVENDRDFEPQMRERSNTVEGKSTSEKSRNCNSLTETNCSSVPTLLDKYEEKGGRNSSSSLGIQLESYKHSPKLGIYKSIKDGGKSPVAPDISDDKNGQSDNAYEEIRGTDSLQSQTTGQAYSGENSEKLVIANNTVLLSSASTSEISDCENTTNNVESDKLIPRLPERDSSFKKMEVFYPAKRKPSKRDSGVGDS